MTDQTSIKKALLIGLMLLAVPMVVMATPTASATPVPSDPKSLIPTVDCGVHAGAGSISIGCKY